MSNSPRISRIDLSPLGGIAGDMFAAACFDAFPNLYDDFVQDIECLGVIGLSASLEPRVCNGLQAKYFSVEQKTDQKPPRTLAGVSEFLQSKMLDQKVCDHAYGIFSLLAAAEAQVHGKTIDSIHFHEVSDWDSMVDIIAAAGIIARLGCSQWRVGALPLGGGSVNTAHGDIPIPAPATLALLKNFQWQDDGIGGERVTPTGAAVLAYLKAQPSNSTALTATLVATGSGCGTRELAGRANILRLTAFGTVATNVLSDQVVRIAFEVDDMTAEEIAWACEMLRSTDGLLDVSSLIMQGKKGRPSTGIRILVHPRHAQSIINQCFTVTSTIGIRHETVDRQVLSRSNFESEDVGERSGVRVKFAKRPDNTYSAKAESDDLAAVSTLQARRQLALQRERIALQRSSDQEDTV